MIWSLWQKYGSSFLRFAVCGGLGAVIDFSTLHALVAYARWSEEYALIVSTGLAMIFVFFSNRFFTFGVRGSGASGQAAKFFLVYMVAAGMNYTLSLGLVYAGMFYLLAKGIAIGTIMFFNFFMLRGFVFKKALMTDEVIAA